MPLIQVRNKESRLKLIGLIHKLHIPGTRSTRELYYFFDEHLKQLETAGFEEGRDFDVVVVGGNGHPIKVEKKTVGT